MKKYVGGCAIGCGVVTLLGFLAVVGLVQYAKHHLPDTTVVEESQRELRERYGAPDAYVPPLDGHIDPSHLGRFVALRESLTVRKRAMALRLDGLENYVNGLEKSRFLQKIPQLARLMRQGMEVIHEAVDLAEIQTLGLLDAGIGEGEASWLYALCLFSWLQWDPMVALSNHPLRAGDWSRDVEEHARKLRDEARSLFLRQLTLQRQQLQQKLSRTPEEEAMLALLDAEIPRAQREPHRFPLTAALAPYQLETLRPYEARLRATLPTTAAEAAVEALLRVGSEEGLNFGEGSHSVRLEWSSD